jgi:8-oxo-dGTP pyrophosphatase MutT (NUDIX family)
MPKEKSVGGTIFREGNQRQFLLLHYNAGHWGFPKGHVEENETERQTLLREIREETGLTGLEPLPGFREKTSYFFRREKQTVFKEVIFYLLEAKSREVNISHEHQGFEWLPFQEALERLSFKNTRQVLEKAKAYLEKH